jgi:hypothetical protein
VGVADDELVMPFRCRLVLLSINWARYTACIKHDTHSQAKSIPASNLLMTHGHLRRSTAFEAASMLGHIHRHDHDLVCPYPYVHLVWPASNFSFAV